MSNKYLEAGKLAAYKVGKFTVNNLPTILTIAGIGAGVASGIFACKGTLKLDEVSEQVLPDVKRVREAKERYFSGEEELTKNDYYSDLAKVYMRAGLKFGKLYAPAIALGVASVTALIFANRIGVSRLKVMTDAYHTVNASFKTYRQRVVDQLGKEADIAFRYGVEKVVMDVAQKDTNGEVKTDKNGEVKTKKEELHVVKEYPGYSEYARIFEEYSVDQNKWQDDAELNKAFLVAQEKIANDILRSRAGDHTPGVVYLNEVYQMLGMEMSDAGRTVGWSYWKHPEEDAPKGWTGDNYISFGIFDIDKVSEQEAERKVAFINGYEKAILLDFNVDGVVSTGRKF